MLLPLPRPFDFLYHAVTFAISISERSHSTPACFCLIRFHSSSRSPVHTVNRVITVSSYNLLARRTCFFLQTGRGLIHNRSLGVVRHVAVKTNSYNDANVPQSRTLYAYTVPTAIPLLSPPQAHIAPPVATNPLAVVRFSLILSASLTLCQHIRDMQRYCTLRVFLRIGRPGRLRITRIADRQPPNPRPVLAQKLSAMLPAYDSVAMNAQYVDGSNTHNYSASGQVTARSWNITAWQFTKFKLPCILSLMQLNNCISSMYSDFYPELYHRAMYLHIAQLGALEISCGLDLGRYCEEMSG